MKTLDKGKWMRGEIGTNRRMKVIDTVPKGHQRKIQTGFGGQPLLIFRHGLGSVDITRFFLLSFTSILPPLPYQYYFTTSTSPYGLSVMALETLQGSPVW